MAPVNAGVIAAVFSSALGGTAAVLTRYTIRQSDPQCARGFGSPSGRSSRAWRLEWYIYTDTVYL